MFYYELCNYLGFYLYDLELSPASFFLIPYYSLVFPDVSGRALHLVAFFNAFLG